uniref:putative Se/S carrier-like protein n=1 Tax=Candidatus Ventrimonas sp. TaxID=3048889 RepID=UPI003FEDF474
MYIATFYSHFGAIRYKRLCAECNISAHVMPVPRDLSSSCGSCVCCEGAYLEPDGTSLEEVEQIVEKTETGYRRIYQAKDS